MVRSRKKENIMSFQGFALTVVSLATVVFTAVTLGTAVMQMNVLV